MAGMDVKLIDALRMNRRLNVVYLTRQVCHEPS